MQNRFLGQAGINLGSASSKKRKRGGGQPSDGAIQLEVLEERCLMSATNEMDYFQRIDQPTSPEAVLAGFRLLADVTSNVTYAAIDIGNFRPEAINDDGLIAGTRYLSTPGPSHPFPNTRAVLANVSSTILLQNENFADHEWADLATSLPISQSRITSSAFDISNFGEVIGHNGYVDPDLAPDVYRTTVGGVIWDSSGKPIDFGLLSDPDDIDKWLQSGGKFPEFALLNDYGRGISDDGRFVVGYAQSPASHPGDRFDGPVLFDRESSWVDSDYLFLSTPASSSIQQSRGQALDVNNTGMSVGFTFNEDGRSIPSVWSSSGALTLIQSGIFASGRGVAESINNAGQVVGWLEDSGKSSAFLWSEQEGLTLLPSFSTNARAYGINDLGQIVGTSGNRGILWGQGVAIDLSQYFESTTYVNRVVDINNRGQIVVEGVRWPGAPTPVFWNDSSARTYLLNPVRGLQPPTIESLTADLAYVVQGQSFTLTANEVRDPDGSVEIVEFYRDSNNNGVLDVGIDPLLSKDYDGADGWSVRNLPSDGLAVGTHRFFARAKDNEGAFGLPASTNLNITTMIAPEIFVDGNGQDIADNSIVTKETDGTNFGVVTHGGIPLAQMFTVRNDGGATLATSGLTVPSGFTITEGLSTSIAPGASDTFTVRLDTTSVGTKSGQISFKTNDGDENPFNFSITGEVISAGTPTITVGNNAAKSVTYTDADGTVVTITVKSGQGALQFSGEDIGINATTKGTFVTGTNVAVSQFFVDDAVNTKITVTTKGGDGRATFGGLTVEGSAASIKMPGVDIEGDVLVTGLVKSLIVGAVTGDAVEQRSISIGGVATDKAAKIIFGNLTDVSLNSDAPVQVTVVSWNDTDPQINPDTLTAPWATTLTAKGDAKNSIVGHWTADVTLTGEGATKETLKKFKAQSLSDAIFEITGAMGTFDVSKGTVEEFTLNLDGDAKTLKLDDVSDSSVTAEDVGTLQAFRWLGGQITSDTIKTLKTIGDKKTAIVGDMNASLTIHGDPAAKSVLGSAAIAGLLSGEWQIDGPVGSVTAGDVVDFTGNVAGTVNAFTSKAAFSGLLAAFSFAKINIKTDLTDASLIAGGNPAGSFINSLKIGGNMTDSSILVGVDPVNGIFDDADDALLGGAASQVKALTIGGITDTDDPMFFAGLFPKSATINKLKVDPMTDPRFNFVVGT